MYEYDEDRFIGGLLAKAMSPGMNDDVFPKVKQVLLDANVIIEYGDGTFGGGKNNITLKEVVKIEQLLKTEIITFPTDKEWLVINRKRKLNKINKINDEL